MPNSLLTGEVMVGVGVGVGVWLGVIVGLTVCDGDVGGAELVDCDVEVAGRDVEAALDTEVAVEGNAVDGDPVVVGTDAL